MMSRMAKVIKPFSQQVILNVDGDAYEIHYNPQKDKLGRVAADFCVRNRKQWGFSVENIQDQCITPVIEKLKESLVAVREKPI